MSDSYREITWPVRRDSRILKVTKEALYISSKRIGSPFPFWMASRNTSSSVFWPLSWLKKFLDFFFPPRVEGERLEIVEDRSAAVGEYFYPFLGESLIAVGQVRDGADRSVFVGQGDVHDVMQVARVLQGLGMDPDRQGPVQEGEEVDEMTDLADYTASPPVSAS